MFRYDASQFSGLSRASFLKALAAEGVPASGGYSPLNTQPFLEETFATRGFKAIYPAEILRRMARSQSVPAERSPVRGSGLAHADDAARPAARHG